MLRQALDAALKGQEQREQIEVAEARSVTETDSLLPDASTQAEQSYAATSNNDEFGESESQSFDDEHYIIEGWEDSARHAAVPEASILGRVWNLIKGCFFLVLNVENLWDSPDSVADGLVSRRNHCVVLFWFFILAASYASERCSFKLLVDRTGPFRLFAVEMVTFSHAMMIGLGMLISAVSRKDFQMQALGIPIVDVGCKSICCIL